jgi:hypothetical protein
VPELLKQYRLTPMSSSVGVESKSAANAIKRLTENARTLGRMSSVCIVDLPTEKEPIPAFPMLVVEFRGTYEGVRYEIHPARVGACVAFLKLQPHVVEECAHAPRKRHAMTAGAVSNIIPALVADDFGL